MAKKTPVKKKKSAGKAKGVKAVKKKAGPSRSSKSVAKTAKTTAKAGSARAAKGVVKKKPTTKSSPSNNGTAKPVPAIKQVISVGVVAKKENKATRLRLVAAPPPMEKQEEEEAEQPVPAELTIEQLRRVKTGLSKRDIEQFRELLRQKRAEILGDVEAMETDARGKNAGGNLSNMPVHMADVGSDNYEQEFTLGLVESERKLLGEINEALERIRDGIYGVCLERGVPIARPRLEVKPWAKYCIEVAREREKRGKY